MKKSRFLIFILGRYSLENIRILERASKAALSNCANLANLAGQGEKHG